MQIITTKRISSLCKLFIGIFFLLTVVAAQTLSTKKSLLSDDVAVELAADLDIDDDNNNQTYYNSILLPELYLGFNEETEAEFTTSFNTKHEIGAEFDKLYILFHQLKLDIG